MIIQRKVNLLEFLLNGVIKATMRRKMKIKVVEEEMGKWPVEAV